MRAVDVPVTGSGAAVHAGWFCWLRCTSCCVSFDSAMCDSFAWWQAHALRHHGGYGPCACLTKPVAIPQVQFLDKVICPSLLRLVPMARQRRKL